MATDDPEITSDFPAPPVYYRSFGEDASVSAPPKPPSDGVFMLFGEQRKLVEVTPTLEDQGLKTLFDPKANRKVELKRLVELSKENFLEVLEAVTESKEQSRIDEKVNALDLCFINLIYMVNGLREEQAKVGIQNMLNNQIKAKNQSCKLLDLACEESSKATEEAFAKSTLPGPAGQAEASMLEASTGTVTQESPGAIVDAVVKRLRGIS